MTDTTVNTYQNLEILMSNVLDLGFLIEDICLSL